MAKRISLTVPSYGIEETIDAIESLLTTYVTMGKKVKDFEYVFSKYIDVKNSIMTTSGSCSNLLALTILSNPTIKDYIKPDSEIITPALTFATTIYPIVNVRSVPVLVDVDMDTLGINVESIEKAITKKTKAIMPVHLLGIPCNIKSIREIADEHDLFLIEDCCDGSGAEVDGNKIGKYGDISTFSFFFTHIMSTIEGGMLSTDNDEYGELAKSIRAFGWARDLHNRDELSQKYNIDSRFLFMHLGYNFKPTDIQGAFGRHQLKKLDGFVNSRRKNADYWAKELETYFDYFYIVKEKPNTKSAWYGYPIILKPNIPFTRGELTNYLNDNGIETRPILSGNFAEQPVMKHIKHRISGELPNAKHIHRHSFFIGNHPEIDDDQRNSVVETFNKFMRSHT